MPRAERVRLNKKTTIKTNKESVAIITSKLNNENESTAAFIIGKELSRLGHIACFSELNTLTSTVITGTALNNGVTIGYLHGNHANSDSASLTHIVSPNTTYEHCLNMLFNATRATIAIVNESDELKLFTQSMPKHQIVGILTSNSDVSVQLDDIYKTSEISLNNILIESNPITLVQKILKRLRSQHITNAKK